MINHELGRAIGLPHSNNPKSIMCTGFKPRASLRSPLKTARHLRRSLGDLIGMERSTRERFKMELRMEREQSNPELPPGLPGEAQGNLFALPRQKSRVKGFFGTCYDGDMVESSFLKE